MVKKYLKPAVWVLLAIAVCGCESVHYYSQAIEGQYRILAARQPISKIMADPESPEYLRESLTHILAVRQFAENELGLPVKKNYLAYVDLKRPYVVWNVTAAPEFSLTPKTWCYPVVGCAAYRGYFTEKNARQYADKLSRRGFEVYVAGVRAYSTLGWFDDPVFSTFIRYSEDQSAALIFHELAHQELYVKGDTAFNESFATAVEQEGLKRWQAQTPASCRYQNYLENYRRQQQFIQLIMHYRRTLEALYQSDASPLDKREQKASIFSALRAEFERLKTAKNNWAAYDNWMNHSLNNAKIASVAAYHDFVPAFHKLLAKNDGNINQFYNACRKLAQETKDKRHRILSSYLEK